MGLWGRAVWPASTLLPLWPALDAWWGSIPALGTAGEREGCFGTCVPSEWRAGAALGFCGAEPRSHPFGDSLHPEQAQVQSFCSVPSEGLLGPLSPHDFRVPFPHTYMELR